jgi:hypothetical protein
VRGLCCENRSFEGLIARVIQHEYDHIEGILFTDKISLKKRLIQKKLKNITEGKTFQDYRMRFIAKKEGNQIWRILFWDLIENIYKSNS